MPGQDCRLPRQSKHQQPTLISAVSELPEKQRKRLKILGRTPQGHFREGFQVFPEFFFKQSWYFITIQIARLTFKLQIVGRNQELAAL